MSHLTTQQYATLKATILADPTMASQPMTSAGATEIARLFNLQASPDYVVWKSSVTATEVGEAFNSTEVGGLTTANTNRLMVMVSYSGGKFNPSRPDTRAAFDAIFSGAGGALTRPVLLALYKRTATRLEKLFATGTGSDAFPATLVLEGAISSDEIQIARES